MSSGHPEVGKPSLNAAQPNAKAEGCVHNDPPKAVNCGRAGPLGLVPGISSHKPTRTAAWM